MASYTLPALPADCFHDDHLGPWNKIWLSGGYSYLWIKDAATETLGIVVMTLHSPLLLAIGVFVVGLGVILWRWAARHSIDLKGAAIILTFTEADR